MDPSHKRPVGDTTGPGSGLKSSVTMTYRHQSTATPATFNFPLTYSYPLLPLIVQSFKTRSHEVIINALQVLGTSYLSRVLGGDSSTVQAFIHLLSSAHPDSRSPFKWSLLVPHGCLENNWSMPTNDSPNKSA